MQKPINQFWRVFENNDSNNNSIQLDNLIIVVYAIIFCAKQNYRYISLDSVRLNARLLCNNKCWTIWNAYIHSKSVALEFM